ncbi:MAG: hypothetical protein JXA98_07860 [Methanosarcinaceae archaeon]|nr:hypothetical protein [Methanosarcinaceae archaeon]
MKPKQVISLVALFALFTVLVTTVSAQTDEDDIVWLEGEEHTLYWGDEVNVSEYLIKALEFSTPGPSDTTSDYVIISIITGNGESWTSMLSVNNSNIEDSNIFDSRLRINATEVVTGNNIATPYTTIEVYLAEETTDTYPLITWINVTVSMEKSASEEIYVDERAYVTIEIENLKNLYFENVMVNETIPENFVLDPDMDIDWTFDLKNNSKKLHSYSLKSLKPGNYTIPATELALTHLGITYYKYTNTSQLTVHGPFINVTKTTMSSNASLDDNVAIKVNVNNEGDRAAHVRISDELPAGATLLSGRITNELVLQPSTNYTINYSIQVDRTNDIILPAATVTFVDAKGYSDTIRSTRIVVPAVAGLADAVETDDLTTTVTEAEVVPTDETTIVQSTPEEGKRSIFGKVRTVPVFVDRVITFIESAISW